MLAALAALIVAILLTAACGGGDDDAAGTASAFASSVASMVAWNSGLRSELASICNIRGRPEGVE